MAFLDAHPLLWLVLAVIVGVTVLRVVARLACLAVAVVVGLALLGAIFGIHVGFM